MVGLTSQDAVFTKGYTLHHDEHQEEHDDSGDGMIMVKLPEII